MDRATSDHTATVASPERDVERARGVRGWYDPDSTGYATVRDERDADRPQVTESADEPPWIDWN